MSSMELGSLPEDRALDAALLVMKNGGSTALVDATFSNVLKGYKSEGASAIWRLDMVAVSRAAEGRTTIVRPVGAVGMHLQRASEAAALGDRMAHGAVDATLLASEIERIGRLPSPYDRWTMVLAAACAGAFFSQTVGGGWGAFGIVFLAGGVGQFARSALEARNLARIPLTFICAAISAMIGAAGLRLGLSHAASATLISSEMYMVPGLALVNGFIDVVSPKNLFVGIQRLLDAALIFLLLTVAVAIADATLWQSTGTP